MDNIFSLIRKEINDFLYNQVEVVPGYTFNQYDTIKRSHLYYNSKFASTNTEEKKRIFMNVSKFRCDTATRLLNIDTKDIRILPKNKGSEFKAFLLEKELRRWLKKTDFARLLNEIAINAPIYGSVVIKKTKDSAKIVDLRRFALDPTVKCVEDSRFVTLWHYKTPTELREMEGKWDNIEQAIEVFGQSEAPQSYENDGMKNVINSSPLIKIYERYGEVPESMLTGKAPKPFEKTVRALFIVAGADETYKNTEGKYTGEKGVILFKSAWKDDYPFADYNYSPTAGRWLGVGVVEELFDTQIRRNELANQKRSAMELSSLHLFQTATRNSVTNVVKDLENGDIITTGLNGTLNPLVNEERNLAAFASEEQQYDTLADRLTSSSEILRGEGITSTMPATNAVIANTNASSVYAFKRENLAIMLEDFFEDFVLKQLLKDLKAEHIIRFVGDMTDMKKLEDELVKMAMEKAIGEFVMRTGFSPTEQERQKTEDKLKRDLRKDGIAQFLKAQDNFYEEEGTEYEFDFLVSNESQDIQKITENTLNAMTFIAQNPQVLNEPRLKLLFYKYLENIGVSPSEIEMAEQAANQAQVPGQVPGVPGQPVDMAQLMAANQVTNQPVAPQQLPRQ